MPENVTLRLAGKSSAGPAGQAARQTFWLPVVSLWWREVVRFYRQPSRVIGGLGSPVLFWVLIGSGLGRSFRGPGAAEGMDYLEYFFPGTLALILLFTAIFSTVSTIEDRREGFLQGVLVAPVSRAGVVLAKVLGGTTLAAVQGFVFLLLCPLAGVPLTGSGLVLAVLLLPLVAFALTALGLLAAWPMDSVQGFHSIMSLFLIPMWLLSGALFPPEGAAAPVRWVMALNPLTYGVAALRRALYWSDPAAGGSTPPLAVSVLIVVLFGWAAYAACVLVAVRKSRGWV